MTNRFNRVFAWANAYPGLYSLILFGICTVTPSPTHAEAPVKISERPVDTVYSSDAADMNLNIDAPQMPGELFPQTRKQVMTPADIKGWPDSKLQYAINEMYARRNVNFGNKNIKKTFLAFEWYTPLAEASFETVEAHFSAIETANLKLMGEARSQSKGVSPAKVEIKEPVPAPAGRTGESQRPHAKSFDEIMKENDEWSRSGMKREADNSMTGLGLQTSLPDGPSSNDIETLLRNRIAHDASFSVIRSDDYNKQEQIEQSYSQGILVNQIRQAEITNNYTRVVEGETMYVYDFDIVISSGMSIPALASKLPDLKHKVSISAAIVKRGMKWYLLPAPK